MLMVESACISESTWILPVVGSRGRLLVLLALARLTLGTVDTRGRWLRVGLGVAIPTLGTVRLFDTWGRWLRGQWLLVLLALARLTLGTVDTRGRWLRVGL